MPGLPERNPKLNEVAAVLYSSCSGAPVPANGIWSKHRDISFDQLQKFWNELKSQARKELLRIDKQTLFEHVRKNFYCSRCNGLLLESFSHIVMYGKSLQQEGGTTMRLPPCRLDRLKNDNSENTTHLSCQDDVQDPFIHPWGGLATTKDGLLTLMDCFLDAKLRALQYAFDSARMRERQRKLLYPDACGGGGRGWISQGMTNYGRGHGTREACALHTARLSCEALLGFWSALGNEMQRSLLRMKEDDFIERLMYRFESKRFCRDCRRNVIREFKELKELKRIRRETRCTIWFCAADAAFEYEVSDNTVQADWHHSFTETVGTYHHFEWAVGTGEGKSDIVEFEDVGMRRRVQVTGLDLCGLTACFITLRAWKVDGRCSELIVKAHALKGEPCVHRRLIVGEGFVTMTEGECIARFFEQAEEAEDDEDDDSMGKDGNEPEEGGSRPQKHAKSPELAREFLLDAAIVIFKEQVERAFREGTARQNAHSVFVCLALKLLEERIHVACKEIITLEKQIKLVEEEEKEKREEEERKERKKAKEREKKLRRKERLKGKDKENQETELKSEEFEETSEVPDISSKKSSPDTKGELFNTFNSEDSLSESGDIILDRPLSPDLQHEQSSNGCMVSDFEKISDDSQQLSQISDSRFNARNVSDSFVVEQPKSFHKQRVRKDYQLDSSSKWHGRSSSVIDDESGDLGDEFESRSHGSSTETTTRYVNGVNRQPRNNPLKFKSRTFVPKYEDKFHCSNHKVRDKYDDKACGCNLESDYRTKDYQNSSLITSYRDTKIKSVSSSDVSRPLYNKSKYTNGLYSPDSSRNPRNKLVSGRIASRDFVRIKQVWEPVDSRKGCPRSNSYPDINLQSTTSLVDACESQKDKVEHQQAGDLNSSGVPPLAEHSRSSDSICELSEHQYQEDNNEKESRNSIPDTDRRSAGLLGVKPPSSSAKDSENCIQQSQGTGISSTQNSRDWNSVPSKDETGNPDLKGVLPSRDFHIPDDGVMEKTSLQQPPLLPSMRNQGISYPVLPAPSTMAYYHQRPTSWPSTPVNGPMSFPQQSVFLIPTHLGYGLPKPQPPHFSMQYSTRQPMINRPDRSQLPVYPLVNQVNSMNLGEETRSSINLGGPEEPITVPDIMQVPSSREVPSNQNRNSGATMKEDDNFSLFHFGGPLSAVTGNNLNAGSLKERTFGDTCSKSPTRKEMTGEEYSLFAASNKPIFPFF